jgi:hypothetical protein
MSTSQLNARMVITGREVMNIFTTPWAMKLVIFDITILLYCLFKMLLSIEDMVGSLSAAPLRSVDGCIHQFF